MKTAEGKLKDEVKKMLKEFSIASEVAPTSSTRGYYNMPVPTGYGTPMLDFVGHYRGFFFAIETKAPGKKPTPRQEQTLKAMRAVANGWACWGDDIITIRGLFGGFVVAADKIRDEIDD